MGVSPQAGRHVLGVEISNNDLVLYLERFFESLVIDNISCERVKNVSFAHTFWSTFGKWSSLLAEDEKVRMSPRDGRRREMLSIFSGWPLATTITDTEYITRPVAPHLSLPLSHSLFASPPSVPFVPANPTSSVSRPKKLFCPRI